MTFDGISGSFGDAASLTTGSGGGSSVRGGAGGLRASAGQNES